MGHVVVWIIHLYLYIYYCTKTLKTHVSFVAWLLWVNLDWLIKTSSVGTFQPISLVHKKGNLLVINGDVYQFVVHCLIPRYTLLTYGINKNDNIHKAKLYNQSKRKLTIVEFQNRISIKIYNLNKFVSKFVQL